MTLSLAFSIEDEAWLAALADAEALCLIAAQAAVDGADVALPSYNLEVSVVLSDDARVHALNREWRGKDGPTNVLSFPALDDNSPELPPDAPLLLGDVILAFETCQTEAQNDRIPLKDHLLHLVVHGVLHLLGYDHLDDDEALEMEALEISILEQLNVPNPYKEHR